MTTAAEHQALPLPPDVQLIHMSTACWVSSIVYAAAKLGLADRLAAGPKSAAELAVPMAVHERSLHRLMRTLASLGILTERSERRFALTPVGDALKSDAPGSARATVLTMGNPGFAACLAKLDESVRSGESAFKKINGMPLFAYLAQNPAEASLFSQTMVGFHGAEPVAVADGYDFSTFETVVDVGGATGNLLAAILARHAGPRGILFDLPHVVAEAPELLRSKGVLERVTIQAGDFFKRVPAGADAYVLSHVIHDWNEEQCVTILGHCRKAMRPDGRVLLVEMVLPEGDAPHPGKMLDIVMLTIPGGEERTASEYGPLLGRAGFRINRVVPTDSAVSIVEAVPA